jgi:hypothetical protein
MEGWLLAPGMALTAEIETGERRVILDELPGIIQMATTEELKPRKEIRQK